MSWQRHMAVTHRRLMKSPREVWLCTLLGACSSHVFIQLGGGGGGGRREGRSGEDERTRRRGGEKW